MNFVERRQLLELLSEHWRAAEAGAGSLLFIEGEAGAGKTSILAMFRQELGQNVRVLAGSCDPLATPAPLGPVIDFARALGDDVLGALTGAEPQRHALVLLLERLAAEPTVVILEDIHWADAGSLDALRFLGRRVGDRRLLLLATYRRHRLSAGEPLSLLLGDLATTQATQHLTVPPLSRAAVEELCAGTDHDPAEVFRITAGNAFFVAQLLAAERGSIPTSITASVLSRSARLSKSAQALLEVAAVVGPRLDRELLASLAGPTEPIEEAISAGLLEEDRNSEEVRFTHELVRLALEESIAPARRRAVHLDALAALRRRPDLERHLAQAAHHAVSAGDGDAILDLVPLAGDRAARLHAHREAADLYETALRWAPAERLGLRADLLRRLAREAYLAGRLAAALSAADEAVAAWEQLGDRLKAGDALYWRSRLSMFAGRRSDAEESSRSAVSLLSELLPGPELALAYNNQAWLRMLACDFSTAADLSRRSIRLGERLQERSLQLQAAITLGASLFHAGDDEGRIMLERCLNDAIKADDDEAVGRSLWNLALISLLHRRYALAKATIDRGLQICDERELNYWRRFLTTAKAKWLLDQGDLMAAGAVSRAHLDQSDAPIMGRIIDLTVAARAAMRAGNQEERALLDEAMRLTQVNPEMEPLVPVRPARAEAAWIAGDWKALEEECRSALDDPHLRADPWVAGELFLWTKVLGASNYDVGKVAEPYRVSIAGDESTAAELWLQLGCPHEAALSLVASRDPAALQQAFSIADRSGARGTAAAVARMLRELGAARIPRGARPSTRRNPGGLTRREAEVLELLAEGIPNSIIAKRLFLSPKTVEHHVSSILRKLDVSSRSEAARFAQRDEPGQVGGA